MVGEAKLVKRVFIVLSLQLEMAVMSDCSLRQRQVGMSSDIIERLAVKILITVWFQYRQTSYLLLTFMI